MTAKFRDNVFLALELFLGVMFVQGGVNTYFANPLHNPSPFLSALAGHTAIYFYATLFLLTGLSLLYSIFFKKKKLKAWTLQTMFLTCLYVLILAWVLVGPSIGMLTTVVVGIISLVCYFHWKFKTAYVTPKEFHRQASEIRNGFPRH